VSQSTRQLPLAVFFSYSHRDELLKDELVVHLASLKRQGVIKVWHDRMISAGTEWAGQIDQHLASADVILLLISPDFIASDYCYDIEMRRALERHERGEARVIPIILRSCDWHGAPFGKLQALPKDAQPVNRWPDRDDALTDVAIGIRSACRRLVEAAALPKAEPAAMPPVSQGSQANSRVTNSGNLVLLASRIYEAQGVEEAADGTVQVRVAPSTSEADAALRGLRGDAYGRRDAVNFAHHNQAFLGRIDSATRSSTGNGALWTLTLKPEDSQRNSLGDMAYNGLSVDDLVELRARLLLLDEKPPRWESARDPMLKTFVAGSLPQLGLESGPGLFPGLWHSNRTDELSFLRRARLWAVFYLVVSEICEHIIDLTLGPLSDGVMDVQFRGRRKKVYSNVEPTEISLKGKCRLTST